MTGLTSMAMMRCTSRRLYRTVWRRSFLAGSLARIHGVVSSIYLLLRWIRAHVSLRASLIFMSSICCSYFLAVSTAIWDNSSSTGSVTEGPAATPFSYCSTMDSVRWRRLPRSLARSALIRSMNVGREKLPSCPRRISRIR